MKSGWETETLGGMCKVVNGGTPKTGVPEYWGGSHCWVTPAEMGKRLTPYISETERRITDLGLRNSSAQLLPPNSVVLSSRAPIGHLVINTEPMATNQGCKGLIPNDHLDHKFLYHYLSSIVDLLNSLGTGATFKELSGGKLKEVAVPIPPLPEQQRIVGILDNAFEGIATAKANAEKNLQNAREVFESYLEAVFSEGGEGWVEKPVVDCFKVRSGDFLPAKAMVQTGEVDVFGGNGIAGTHDQKNLSGENIIIGRVGAKCGNVRHVKGDLWLTDNAFFISEYFRGFDLGFMARALERKDLRTTANQAAQPVISYKTIKDVILEFPDSEKEQEAIADKLNGVEAEIRRVESIYKRKIDALDALKSSLLHQAFSGQL